GEGWAWGSYLNGPMSADQSPFAYAATQKAISLRDKASPKERAFIDALAVRYVKDFVADKRKEQDQAYADAMAKVAAQFPDDLDAITLYADALFILEPRRGTRDVNAPNMKRLHAVLESALKIDPKHPGACHLYVHATESTVRPGLAEACAEYLGTAARGRHDRSLARLAPQVRSPPPATSITCRRTRGMKWAAGAIRSKPIPLRG